MFTQIPSHMETLLDTYPLFDLICKITRKMLHTYVHGT